MDGYAKPKTQIDLHHPRHYLSKFLSSSLVM